MINHVPAKKPTKKDARISDLSKELRNQKAADILTLKIAHAAIARMTKDRYMASGLVITIRNISGKELAEPFMISDGFSKATIDALLADIKATHEQRLAMASL